MKQVTLTILSEQPQITCAISKDDNHNVWVHMGFNGATMIVPLAVFTVFENAVYDFIGEEEGEEH